MVLSVDMQATHAVQMIHALSYETSDHLHVYNHWWSVCLAQKSSLASKPGVHRSPINKLTAPI